jgi:hypothetical protein
MDIIPPSTVALEPQDIDARLDYVLTRFKAATKKRAIGSASGKNATTMLCPNVADLQVRTQMAGAARTIYMTLRRWMQSINWPPACSAI